jgi:hypothetical protein
MSPASETFQGWTLAEALERTANPELWRAWIAAKGAWEKVRVPTPSDASTPLHRSPRDIQALRHAADDAFHQVKSVIWQHLTQERLTAIGSRGNGSEPPTPIHSAAWQGLIFKHGQKSVVEERGSKTRIFNVRVFPVLHAPDVHVRLVGCSVSDVFRRFVIEDPELVLLGKRVSAADERHVPVFQEGYYPGWGNDFKWPLELTAGGLANQFMALPIIISSDPAPRASEAIHNASRVIVDRWQALRRVLISGEVIVRGTFVATGIVETIDPFQWPRRGLWIEVQNGDLFEEKNGIPVLQWSGLVLVAPFHVKPLVYDGILPATTEQQRASTRSTKAVARVETSIASSEACRTWLVGIMRASPDERTESKQSIWNKAREKWGGSLSQRSFFAAWAEAIRITGAIAWSVAGAPVKSPRKSAR